MKRIRAYITALVFITALVLKAGIGLAEDTTADEWVTSGGNTYVLSGNVGIGVTSPSSELEIEGTNNILTLNSTNPNANINFLNTEQNWQIGRDTAVDGFYFFDTAYRMVIKDGGNVGIGTTDPGNYKLAVEGKIGAREVVVTEAAWSDFVFDDNHTLPPLDQVESYIKTNEHLPDIPSAQEIKAEGISISKMMAKQMQKIEELTLYVIEQNKKLVAQNKKIEGLEKKLSELEDSK